MTNCASWIRRQRLALGLSTRDLARLAGVAYPTVSRIENEHEQPRWSTLEKIYEVVGHPPPPSSPEALRLRLADLTDALADVSSNTPQPDWVRLRALVDQLRLRPGLIPQAINPEPRRSASPLLDNVLAAMAEKLADDAGIARPAWTVVRVKLDTTWCAAVRPAKRAEAEASTPPQFLERGVIMPAATLWRERELRPA